MSARITLHFYNRQGALFTHTSRGWLMNPAAPTVFTAAADARRFALASGWMPGLGRRVFLRVELAGRIDHQDLWTYAPPLRPLPRPGLPILAEALA
jgi:hypothetical protein